MCIPDFLKAKDLQRITGKSPSQCSKDFTEIKEVNGKTGRKKLITTKEVADFYGLSETEVINRLNKQVK